MILGVFTYSLPARSLGVGELSDNQDNIPINHSDTFLELDRIETSHVKPYFANIRISERGISEKHKLHGTIVKFESSKPHYSAFHRFDGFTPEKTKDAKLKYKVKTRSLRLAMKNIGPTTVYTKVRRSGNITIGAKLDIVDAYDLMTSDDPAMQVISNDIRSIIGQGIDTAHKIAFFPFHIKENIADMKAKTVDPLLEKEDA